MVSGILFKSSRVKVPTSMRSQLFDHMGMEKRKGRARGPAAYRRIFVYHYCLITICASFSNLQLLTKVVGKVVNMNSISGELHQCSPYIK